MNEGAPKPPPPEMPPIPEKFKIGSIWETSFQNYAVVTGIDPKNGVVKLTETDLLFMADTIDSLALMSIEARLEEGELKYNGYSLNHVDSNHLPKKFKNKALSSQLAEKMQMLRDAGIPEDRFIGGTDATVEDLTAQEGAGVEPNTDTIPGSGEPGGEEVLPGVKPEDLIKGRHVKDNHGKVWKITSDGPDEYQGETTWKAENRRGTSWHIPEYMLENISLATPEEVIDYEKDEDKKAEVPTEDSAPADAFVPKDPDTLPSPFPSEPIPNPEPTPPTGDAPKGEDTSSSISETQRFAEKERSNMEQTEREYLDEYKKFHATKKFWNLKEPKHLQDLKKNYDTNRSAYARALDAHSADRIRNDERFSDDKLRERLEQRLATTALGEMRDRVEGWLNNIPSYREHLQDKYDSVVKYREIVSRAADKRLNARFEGMDSRKQGRIEKSFKWLASTNAKFEEQVGGKMSARVIRAAATTAVIGGTAAAFGSGLGIAAMAGWGAVNIGRIVMAGTLGAAYGEAMARVYGAYTKREARVEKEGNNRGVGEGLDEEHLAKYDRIQKAIQNGTNERVRREQMSAVRIAASILGGAGVGASLGMAFNSSGPDTAPAGDQQPELPPADAPSEAPARPVMTPETAPAATPHPEVSTQSSESVEGNVTSVRLDEGDGANQLLKDLRAELRMQYGDNLSSAPESVQKILSSDICGWSDKFEFLNDEGSLLLHEGTTLEINENGELVLNDPSGIRSVTLLDRNGNEFQGTEAAGDANGISDVERYRHLHTGAEAQADRADATPLEQKQQLGRVIGEVESTTAVPNAPVAQESRIDSMPDVSALPPIQPQGDSMGVIPMDQWNAGQGNGSGNGENMVPQSTGGAGMSPEPIADWNARYAPATEELNIQPPVPDIESSNDVPPGFGTSGARDLPTDPAAFGMRGSSNEVFVHSGGSPEKNFQLAKEYAQAHPGSKVYFDNAQERWGGLRAPIARIGSISFAEGGQPVLNPQELDVNGRPITSVEQRLERQVSL